MSNVKRGRRRNQKLRIWANPEKLTALEAIAEDLDLSRDAAIEVAMTLFLAASPAQRRRACNR
jgi:hypothetical protein